MDWLRVQGHDVLAVRDTARGSPDPQVLALAMEQARMLLTADKDFGDLAFRKGLPAPGIIFLRLRSACRQEYLDLFMSRWPDMSHNVAGNFVVVANRAVRVRPLP